MRPGLGKPGALPLLALVVFSLLTLAPSLSSIYNINFADFPYASRQVPLIQESISDPSAEHHLLNSPRNAWGFAPSPRANRPRSPRPPNGPIADPGETAPVANKSRLASDSSFMFSRRARAFRTYFIRQLEYPFLSPFANRSRPAESLGSSPNFAPANITSLPTPLHNPSDPIPAKNASISSFRGLRVPSLGAAWQQACYAAVGLRGLPENAPAAMKYLIESGASVASSTLSIFKTEAPTAASTSKPEPRVSKLESGDCACKQEYMDISHISSENETTDAAGQHSTELRGSCMAVVIGLVAGIAWF